MTKAMCDDLDIKDRCVLINELLKIGYIPIYQDNDDVVAKNLTYL